MRYVKRQTIGLKNTKIKKERTTNQKVMPQILLQQP